ncbi:MAG TPA: hypothetical protein VGQ47_03915 [Candidatus Limnocylindrales bacterium]|jgi:hypothetical protein|nr:hypothetical protein [Candidatus Limnocylindrales bacterium]
MSETETPAIFIDLEGALIEVRPGRERPAFSMQPAVDEGLRRLAELTDTIVALVEPAPSGSRPRPSARLVGSRASMVQGGPKILFVGCPHTTGRCRCAKPYPGLIELAASEHGIPLTGAWHITSDALGVQAGRAAGLKTIRIGPHAGDPESAVHRPDYEARDLLDAANWILVQALGQPTA